MLKKSKKGEIIKSLEKAVLDSKSVVFVNFHKLKVSDETALRRSLREQGVSYKVSRKTLLARALSDKAKGEMPELKGEVAVVFSGDDTSGAREIYNFEKKHKGVLSILGGIFEGKFINASLANEIAMIPDRQTLYAQFVNVINSPIQGLALALNEIAKIKQ